MPTEIEFIRHGTPVGGNMYRGNSIDDELSETGWSQMRSAIGESDHWQHIISSPMKRCRAFADELASKLGLETVIDERLKEVGFGEWEGKSSHEIQQRDPRLISKFYYDPVGFRPEGAENLKLFQQRVADAIDHMLASYQDKKVLAIAHAGVMRAVITHITKASASSMYRISIGNAAIIKITDDGVRPPTLKIT